MPRKYLELAVNNWARTLPSESESESGDEEIIEPRKLETKKTAKKQPESKVEEPEETEEPEEEAEAGEGEEKDDDDDEEEEVYTVENVVAHAYDFPDEQVRYQVKWLGYDKKSDLTWETEENLQGAIDVLQAYFDSIGGRPETTRAASTKKRGRQSTGKTDTPDKQVKKVKTEEVPKKKDGRGRKKKSSPGIMDLESTLKDGWEPPKPLPGAWEEGVLTVQTIEGNDDGTKWAYLSWADEGTGAKKRQTKALLSTCYIACPQVMLKFFESHLVFTDKKVNSN
ncbi:hypothetical protein MMC15_001616 [Xylographa vitiligo]|nr:hypothetical protein [Xylographa vitiligo]